MKDWDRTTVVDITRQCSKTEDNQVQHFSLLSINRAATAAHYDPPTMGQTQKKENREWMKFNKQI